MLGADLSPGNFTDLSRALVKVRSHGLSIVVSNQALTISEGNISTD